ncbi:TPA: hypothetical protein DDW35_08805, partial [Candidatus Sumerlaeota bacterium]|nr:hypothetical protein [Candidatus Sumerlaeota bacterium]
MKKTLVAFLLALLSCSSMSPLYAQITAGATATPEVSPTPMDKKAWEGVLREKPEYQQKYQQLINSSVPKTAKATPTATPKPSDVTFPEVRSPQPKKTPQTEMRTKYPPEQVVVAEIGDMYKLTLKELWDMLPVAVSTKLREKSKDDPFLRLEVDRQETEAENDALRNWVLNKGLTAIAIQKGTTVTNEEVNAKYQQLQNMQGNATPGATVAVAVKQDTIQQELRAALILNKYIQSIVSKRFGDQDLAKIYARTPELFMQPPQIHAWQIFEEIRGELSDNEVRDLRGEFYKVWKRSTKNGGKDFEKVAAEVNPMIGQKRSSGDLGWVGDHSELAPELLEVLAKMKPGEVSQIIRVEGKSPSIMSGAIQGTSSKAPNNGSIQAKTGGSLHILKVVERQEAKGTTFDDFARQRVIESLIESYKNTVGPKELENAPFKITQNRL